MGHGRFLQIHGTSKLTSPYCSTGYEIYDRNIWHWDNPLRPGWIPRHNIQRKMRKSYMIDVKAHFKRKPSSIYIFTSYHPPIVKMDLTNKKPWESYKETSLRKYFRFQKAVDEQRLATQAWKKHFYWLEVKLTEGKQRSWNKPTRKKKNYCLSWHNTSP